MKFLEHLQRLDWLIALLAAIWIVQLANMAMKYRLNARLGLRPRDMKGLIGILTMPLLHGNVAHASANSYPLITLGALMGLSDETNLVAATGFIILAGGVAVWLFARSALHVGASGLVFGWFGYLLIRAWVAGDFQSFVIAAAVAGSYWTLVFGMLPRRGRVSWEAHLFGALAGGGAAYILHI